MINRSEYLQKILPFIDKPLIKVIIGVRRSGKTVLMSQLRDYIAETGVESDRLISLNFESLSNSHLLDEKNLHAYIMQKSASAKGRRLYLFFDEIQEVNNWQKAVNSLAVDIDCDIYLTGSNSNMLSGELATYIAGRYVHFTVYPFTLDEIKRYYAARNNRTKADETLLDEYLKFGGLPQRFIFDDENSIRAYLEDVYSTIVIKDVMMRNRISDIGLLTRLTAFLLDNIGNTFSANAVCNKLKAEGIHTTVATLINYIAAIKSAMVVQSVQRYDIKGKALLSTSEKYYATDLGLRNNVKSSESIDYGRLYENIVYLEMRARGYEIHVGKLGDYEIDFICTKNGKKLYIQVAYLLADREITNREIRPLLAIADNYPKYIVSGDIHDLSGEGIIHKNIISFLLDKTI